MKPIIRNISFRRAPEAKYKSGYKDESLKSKINIRENRNSVSVTWPKRVVTAETLEQRAFK